MRPRVTRRRAGRPSSGCTAAASPAATRGAASPRRWPRTSPGGYVTVSINYRLLAPNGCSGANGVSNQCLHAALEATHDGQAAVRWLRANAATYRIDPTRIGIGGESAGAIVATATGLHSEDPGTSGNPGFPSTVRAFQSLSGGLPNAVFAGPGDAPGLLFSGTADPIVPFKWSVDTAVALNKAGVPAVLETWQGAGHVPFAQFQQQITTQSVYFFYDLMDLGHAAGQPPAASRAFERQVRGLAARHPALARRYAPALKQAARR